MGVQKRNIIYGLHNGDGMIRYVGRTKHGNTRFSDHKFEACKGLNRAPVYKWMRKYGIDNIVCQVLEVLESALDLPAREDFWIEALGTQLGAGGMNMGGAMRGGIAGATIPDDVKAKMSKAARARIANESEDRRAARLATLAANGRLRPFLGRNHTAETLAKQSATYQRLGSHKGERNGRAILNAALAAEIRTRSAAGESLRSLALEYGVGKTTIANITANHTWKVEVAA